MRKLKLQMHISVDGFVAGLNGEMDWMTVNLSNKPAQIVDDLIDSSDTILMGRKMTDGFVNYWEDVVNNQPESPKFEFAKKMVDTPKIVFSKTLEEPVWNNTVLAKGNLAEEIARLKNQNGKDLLVYGGATFVSSLIEGGHIDEYNLFVNPVLINKGMRIFGKLDHRQKLSLIESTAYEGGITVLRYRLLND